MRFVRQTIEPRFSALGAVVGGLLTLGAAGAAVWFRLGLPQPSCRFREWTGFPCATCGTTRMVEALLSGKILEAAAWNPLLFVAAVVIAVWSAVSVTRVIFGIRLWRIELAPRERRGLALATVGATLISWGYLLWSGV